MLEGRKRKRLAKLARRVPIDEVRSFACPDDGETPRYFVLREHGYELLRSWQFPNGVLSIYQLSGMEDEVFYAAIIEYAKSRNLIFESEDLAIAYARTHIEPKVNMAR